MNIIVEQPQLLAALGNVTGALARDDLFPIRNNVLLIAHSHPQSLQLIACDMSLEDEATVIDDEGIDVIEQGQCTVPGKKLFQLVRSLPKVNIQITLDNHMCILKAGRSRFKLQTLPADDFPRFDMPAHDMERYRLPASLLLRLIESAQHAASKNDARYYLNGVLVEGDAQSISAVATDGHRLSAAVLADPGVDVSTKCIVPTSGITEIRRLLKSTREDVDFLSSDESIHVSASDQRVSSKLLVGNYPTWRNAVPNPDDGVTVTLEPEMHGMIVNAVRQVSAVISDMKGLLAPVRLTLSPNTLSFTGASRDKDDAETAVDVEYSGDKLAPVSVHATYLLDALGAIDAALPFSMHFFGGESAFLMTQSIEMMGRSIDLTHAIMPMRV